MIKDTWSYVKPYKGRFFVASFSRIMGDLAWLYPPYALAIIIDFLSAYSPKSDLSTLYLVFGLTIITVAVRYLGMYTSKTIMFGLAESVCLDAQAKLTRHIMMADMSWHEREGSGGKFKKIDRGAEAINKVLRIWVNNIIEIVINLFGIIFIFLRFDTKIAITVAIFLTSYFLLSSFFRKKAVRWSNTVSEKEEHRSSMLFETINNIRTIKTMYMIDYVESMLKNTASEIYRAVKERIFWYQAGNSLRNFYAHIFRITVMAYIAYGIINGFYTAGFLVLFITYFSSIWQSISELTDVSEDFAEARIAVGRMQNLLQAPITIDRENNKKPYPSNWQTIHIKELSFSYGDKPVLKDISFDIKRGEKIGIVGLSGAGKSTLFKLLLKERANFEGKISFDDTLLQDISKKDYLRHVSVVLQETELFNSSLRNNIVITNYNKIADQAALEKAIRISHVDSFIYKLPAGIDTVIGEKGIKLSGGEKQRVGIARAVYKDPDILFLDEATSHLDMESEEKIKDSLHHFFQDVTAIIIAHRLTTIKEMDRIVVIENGGIIEIGSFQELISIKGRFYELWQKQQL